MMIRTVLYLAAGLASLCHAQVPRVAIKETLLPVGVESTLKQVQIRAPVQVAKLFCVSEVPASNVQFYCVSCNLTNATDYAFNQEVMSKTRSLSQQAGYPAAELSGVRVNGNLNGYTLGCNATYTQTGHKTEARETARISVLYMDTPVIRNNKGGTPIGSERTGWSMYVSRSSQLSLLCQVRANPPATKFQWSVDSAVQSTLTGATATFSAPDVQFKIVQCKASNENEQTGGEQKDSAGVKIYPYIAPKLTATNFQKASEKTLTLNQNLNPSPQCQATGNPQPIIVWKIKPTSASWSQAINATCERNVRIDGGQYNPQPYDQQPYDQTADSNGPYDPNRGLAGQGGGVASQGTTGGVMTSTYKCDIKYTDYHMAGDLYCAACTEVANGQYECDPADGQPAVAKQRVVVQGPPLVNTSETEARTSNNDQDAQIKASYCSDPPIDKEKSYWDISGTQIPFGDRGINDRYKAYEPIENATYKNCYTALMEISPIRAEDKNKQLTLVLANGFKSLPEVRTVIDAHNVLGSLNGEESKSDVGLALAIALPIIAILLILLLIFLWWRKAVCFAPKKKDQKYHSNVVQGGRNGYESSGPGVHREPEPLPRKTPPPGFGTGSVDGYSNAGSEISSTGFRQSHEGLTYAELDLVQTNPTGGVRLPPHGGGSRPPGGAPVPPARTDYASINPGGGRLPTIAQSVNSSQNSVV